MSSVIVSWDCKLNGIRPNVGFGEADGKCSRGKNAERGVEYQQPEHTNVIESLKRHIAWVRALNFYQLWTMSIRMASSLEHISWQSPPLFENRIAQERLRSCLNWLWKKGGMSQLAGRINQVANRTRQVYSTKSCFLGKMTLIWKDNQFGLNQFT